MVVRSHFTKKPAPPRCPQRALPPLRAEEIVDRIAHLVPERFAVGFEDCPLGVSVDRMLLGDEVATEDDVLPFSVPADYNNYNPPFFSHKPTARREVLKK